MGTKEFWKFDPATEEVELRPIPGKMLLLCLDGYNKSNDVFYSKVMDAFDANNVFDMNDNSDEVQMTSMGCTMMVIWVVGGFL
ncbi:hypothetical protein L915_08289 [Phytophthora nicotianae]|uniref:Uncharacterized protein n=1 Tax=Phytophthora nicotianae TaxID=4792 RepID=W2GW28_PHYNI|nr:hypothetical protein L915_08289 [Phytophthora nicotianae]